MGVSFHDTAASRSSFKDFAIWPIIAISWHETNLAKSVPAALKGFPRLQQEEPGAKCSINMANCSEMPRKKNKLDTAADFGVPFQD